MAIIIVILVQVENHIHLFSICRLRQACAIALGFGSIYNHAVHANADFILDFENNTIDIVAIRDIAAGEEITINYHGETGNDEKLWFDE